MKLLLATLLLLSATTAWAQFRDPRDSVILESKTVSPQSGPCASAVLKVRVYITNKDSLASIALPFETRSISGSAYATLSRRAGSCTRTIPSDVFNFLYPPGPSSPRLPTRSVNYNFYHSDPPDTFLLAFTLDNPGNDDGKVPPNPTRVLLGELKFDSVNANFGQFEIDSGKVLANTIVFVDLPGRAVRVNFLKSTITVAPKGDMNLDGILTAADVVLVRNCVVLGIPPPAGAAACDLNCDGMATAADFVLSLNATFLGDPFPC